jgi:hypothetical protein
MEGRREKGEGRRKTRWTVLFFFLLPASCFLLPGCVRRQLTIRSEPPGAQIMVNDGVVGTTPFTHEFEWYGWHRITLTKEGYERLDDHVNLTAPARLWIPLDLVMELLPLTIQDDREFSYHLAPLTPLPEPKSPMASAVETTQKPSTSEESHDGDAR